jgi:hypothetical protein
MRFGGATSCGWVRLLMSSVVLVILAATVPGARTGEAASARQAPSHPSRTAGTVSVVLRAGASVTVNAVPGYTVRVEGTGFLASEPVTLAAGIERFGAGGYSYRQVLTANAAGTIVGAVLPIPPTARQGSVELRAVGERSRRVARAFIHIDYHPTLGVTPPAAAGGTAILAAGSGFVPGFAVAVTLRVRLQNGADQVLQARPAASGDGSWSVSLGIPSGVRNGSYIVRAIDSVGAVSAATRVAIASHAVVTLQPAAVIVGHTVLITGSDLPADMRVTVSATFPVRTGGAQTVSASTVTTAQGTFAVPMIVPSNARPSRLNVSVASRAGIQRAVLTVLPRPVPAPAPAPTATPTAVPTVAPAPPPPPPVVRSHGLRFARISLWYQVVRPGTKEHIVLYARPKKVLGIWMQVVFPSGKHLYYFAKTRRHGKWSKTFRIPRHVRSPYSNQGYIILQLWHGRQTTRVVMPFSLD